MYGLRDAAQNWESEYIEFMSEIKFPRGAATPCMSWHAERELRFVVHGDDFTILGYLDQHIWFRKHMESRYDIKYRGHIGSQKDDEKSIIMLNRIVEWTDEGVVYNSDQRHADIIVRYLGLGKANGVVTPGEKKHDKVSSELDPSQATQYRAWVARGIVLAQDRSDIAYSVKDLSREMSNPDDSDGVVLKRLGRNLVIPRRYQTWFAYQSGVSELTIWSDSDYAGCVRTRKSTRGGIALLGVHCITSWSTTQGVVAMSSGEAEFYAMVKGSCMGIGLKSLMRDMGIRLGIRDKTDASAAKGIANRTGLGKVRHVEVKPLWLQYHVSNGKMHRQRVKTGENRAYAMTKYLNREGIGRRMEGIDSNSNRRRHELSPEVSKTESDKEASMVIRRASSAIHLQWKQ